LVTASVVGLVQGPKLVVQRFRRRKNSRRHNGHRQLHTTVKIEKISVG
jgi:large subunit ribosomal protein L21